MSTTNDVPRTIIVGSMVVALVLSGAAFAYKIAEFIFALTSEGFQGAFDVPILVYFAVAIGWLSLLAWCFLTGRFGDMERTKNDMLAQEEWYEEHGI